MRISRRSFLKSALVFVPSLTLPQNAFGQHQSSRELPKPNPTLLQSGDLVWPKKPGAYVPFNSGSRNSPAQDREQWIAERDAYLHKYGNRSGIDDTVRLRIETLRNMEYREFIAVYAGAQQLGVPGAYSGGAVYVGHVGIIEVDSNGSRWVIEALIEKGVRRTLYTFWIIERPDEVVWLGRLRQLGPEQRAMVAGEAKRFLGRPYDFWNFDLGDDSGFYCSKLVWLSIYRSLGFAIDGNDNPKRMLWFSPKQCLYLPTIERIHDPGPYAL